jgi:hypothetical protein
MMNGKVGTHCYVQKRESGEARQVTQFGSEYRERDCMQPLSKGTIKRM